MTSFEFISGTLGYIISAALLGVAVGMAAHLVQGLRARQLQARRLGSRESMIGQDPLQKALSRWFRRIGIHENPSFVGFALTGGCGFMIPTVYGWGALSGVVGLMLGLLVYIGLLRDRWNRKLKIAESQISGLLDLLSVSIQAGATLNSGLSTAAKILAKGLLSTELNRALSEIQIGRPRSQALNDLSDRVPLAGLRQAVIAIHQSESTGSPLSQVLADEAKAARSERLHRLEAEAQKLPIKLLFPLLVFIFPITLVIVLAPILLRLTEG